MCLCRGRKGNSRAQVIQIVSRHMRLFIGGLDNEDYEGSNVYDLVTGYVASVSYVLLRGREHSGRR
jgi:hypothetical protein